MDLLIIIGFAIEIIDRLTEFRSLRGLAEHWRESLRQYGPGIIDMKLEQFVVGPEGARSFERLLTKILEDISQYREKIPATVLNQRISVSGVTFNDSEVTNIEGAVRKLQAIFSAA